jgi:stress-induced morphogen
MERRFPNVLVMIRVRVFSAIYGGISRVKRHHSGAVGRVLGKELGKDFRCHVVL